MKEQKDKAEIDKKKIYAQLLVDFANSKTTDEAILEYLSNLQKVYNFSQDFAEEAQVNFPRMLVPFDPENIIPENKKIVELMSRENELHSLINKYFQDGIFITSLDEKRSESICLDRRGFYKKIPSHGKTVFPDYPVQYYVQNLVEGKPTLDISQLSNREKRYIKKIDENEINPIVKEWVIINEELIEFKVQCISDELTRSFIEQGNIDSRLNIIIGEHYRVKLFIDTIRILLQAIVDDCKDIATGQLFKRFMDVYNDSPKSKVYLSTDLKVRSEKQVHEHLFLNKGNYSDNLLKINCYYDHPIADCVVEFLKHPPSEDNDALRIIKKCNNERCHKFYVIERDIKDQKFCSKKCRSVFHNSREDHKKQVAEIVSIERAKGNYD